MGPIAILDAMVKKECLFFKFKQTQVTKSYKMYASLACCLGGYIKGSNRFSELITIPVITHQTYVTSLLGSI
jgi:hypothetical protein